MPTPRLSKESARHLHRESWDVRPHLHAHGRRRSDDGDEFVEVLTLLKLGAKVVLLIQQLDLVDRNLRTMARRASEDEATSLLEDATEDGMESCTPVCTAVDGCEASFASLLRRPAVQLLVVVGAYAVAAVAFDFYAAPGFHSGEVYLVCVALLQLFCSPRKVALASCLMLLLYAFFGVFVRALWFTPLELVDGFERTRRGSHGVALISLSMGAWLGHQPRASLTLREKALFACAMEVLRVGGLGIMSARTGHVRSLLIIYGSCDLLLLGAFFAAARVSSRRERHERHERQLEALRWSERQRDADSRVLHAIERLCGGAVETLESFHEMWRQNPGAMLSVRCIAKLLQRPQEQLLTAVQLCRRRDTIQHLAGGVAQEHGLASGEALVAKLEQMAETTERAEEQRVATAQREEDFYLG